MCQWIRVEETYWTVCWKWIFPYPCRKSRVVNRWCCHFEWIKENRWLFFCTLEGCSSGQRYNWTGFCLNLFGSEYFYNIDKCFDSAMSPSGKC